MSGEANVIDALLVTIGIDPSGVTEGKKKALADLQALRDDSLKNAKEVEKRNKHLADSVGSIKSEVLGLTLAFAGANGIKDFFANVMTSNAALGRTSKNLGVATKDLFAYQYAVKAVGGSAEDANASMQTMYTAMEAARMGAQTPGGAALLRLGVSGDDAQKGEMGFIEALAENRTHLNPQDRNFLMQQAGLDQNSINAITDPNFLQNLARGRQLAPSDNDIKQAQELQKAWADLTTTLTHIATPALTTFARALNALALNIDPQSNQTMQSYDHKLSMARQEWDALKKGDYATLSKLTDQDIKETLLGSGPLPGQAGGMQSGPRGRAVGGLRFNPNVDDLTAAISSRGVNAGTARGVAAGIMAEGGGLGMAANGAFGIGQWRGSRLRALMAKYGPNPTLHQQLDFLVGELKGGDPGGTDVLVNTDSDEALHAYIWKFMRPQGRHNEHYMDAVRDNDRGSRVLHGARSRVAGRMHVSHQETHIGQINVNAPNAKDGPGIAKTLPPAIKRRGLTAQANSGLSK